MKKVDKERISYIEQMMKETIKALKDFNSENTDGYYIFQSSNRAKFDRLRIELTKELLNLKKEVYKEKD